MDVDWTDTDEIAIRDDALWPPDLTDPTLRRNIRKAAKHFAPEPAAARPLPNVGPLHGYVALMAENTLRYKLIIQLEAMRDVALQAAERIDLFRTLDDELGMVAPDMPAVVGAPDINRIAVEVMETVEFVNATINLIEDGEV